MRRILLPIIQITFWVSLILPLMASPIDVLTLNESRIGTSTNANGSINFNFATGDAYAPLRNDLLDPSKFGAGAPVSRDVNIMSAVGVFSEETLLGADVLIVNKSGVLSAEEKDAVELFVRQGGGLFVFNNTAAQEFASLFGATAGAFDPSGQATVSAGPSPANNGPFGTVTAGTLTGAGFAGSFSDLGSSGVASLDNANILGGTFALDNGRAAIFSDEEIFSAIGVSGIGAGHLNSTSSTIFLNAFSHIAPDESFVFTAPVPEPSSSVLLLLALFLGGVSRKK